PWVVGAMRSLRIGDLRGRYLTLPVTQARWIARQGPLRRARGDRATGVIRPSMAGAEEQLGARLPPDRAAQVLAVNGEGREMVVGVAAQPGGLLGRHAGPRHGRGV